MKRIDYTIKDWTEYKLLDSGNSRKLESFGGIVLDRPEPQALWNKKKPDIWQNANAQFIWADKGERWKITSDTKHDWTVRWNDLNIDLHLKDFKHIGVFPEHSILWDKIISLGNKYKGLKMLNLFGYTGVDSMAGALFNMEVTHVDASKQASQIFKNNLKKSNLEKKKVRIIVEDTLKYVKRLIARGEKFDVIIIDPPVFGRGPKGEVWKIEESLLELMSLIPQILTDDFKMIALSGYASGSSARVFAEIMSDIFGSKDITYGEIGIKEDSSNRILVTGIYATCTRN